MRKILYLNVCVRPESRTNRLAKFALSQMHGEITELRLGDEKLLPLDSFGLEERNRLISEGDLEHGSFWYARQFAKADVIVIAAPYWDLSFPSALKVYFERINVCGITFQYTEEGIPQSLCSASRLIYITTAGGKVVEPNMGYHYVGRLAETFYGISKIQYYQAEGLDIDGADVEKILLETEKVLEKVDFNG